MTEAEYRQALAEAQDTILFIVRENVMIKRQAAAQVEALKSEIERIKTQQLEPK